MLFVIVVMHLFLGQQSEVSDKYSTGETFKRSKAKLHVQKHDNCMTKQLKQESFNQGPKIYFNILALPPKKSCIMFCLPTDKESSGGLCSLHPLPHTQTRTTSTHPTSFSFKLTIFFLRMSGGAPDLFKKAPNAAGSSPNIKCSLIAREDGGLRGWNASVTQACNSKHLVLFMRFGWSIKMNK